MNKKVEVKTGKKGRKIVWARNNDKRARKRFRALRARFGGKVLFQEVK